MLLPAAVYNSTVTLGESDALISAVPNQSGVDGEVVAGMPGYLDHERQKYLAEAIDLMKSTSTFLADKQPALTVYVSWGRQGLDFDVASYLYNDIPPEQLVTSVRGIVRYQGQVVVMENEDGRHFMPGGRLEPGESFEAGLHREIQEECGLRVESSTLLGFLHFRHRQPRPEHYPYPYPEMFHLVYAVDGAGTLVQADEDGYEFATHLYRPADAFLLPDTEPGHPFLKYVVEHLV